MGLGSGFLMRSEVQFPSVKSPLYLTKTCQVVNCLMCFGVGLSTFCLQKKKKEKCCNSWSDSVTFLFI